MCKASPKDWEVRKNLLFLQKTKLFSLKYSRHRKTACEHETFGRLLRKFRKNKNFHKIEISQKYRKCREISHFREIEQRHFCFNPTDRSLTRVVNAFMVKIYDGNSWQGVTSKKNLKNLFFSIFQVFKALQLIPQGTLFVHKNIQPEVFYE